MPRPGRLWATLTGRIRTGRGLWLLAISALALVVRAGVVAVVLNTRLLHLYYDASDSILYRGLAASITSGHGYTLRGSPTAIVSPGYPLFLSAIYQLSRATWLVAAAQCVLGALTVGIMADLAWRLAGRKAGIAAGVIAAFYPGLLFWTGYVLTETLYIFFLVLALWLAAQVTEHPELRAVPILSGACFGVAALTRPPALGFVVLVVLAAVAFRRLRRPALLVTLGFVAVLLPWVVRNEVSLHGFVVTDTESGYVLWQGDSPGATGGSGGYVDRRDYTPLRLPAGLTEVQIDNTYRNHALAWMRSHPSAVLRLVPAKVWNMWRPTYAGASKLDLLVTLLTYVPVMALAVIGAGLAVASRRPAKLLVVLFVCYHVAFHAITSAMIRFRAPAEAGIVILAGIGAAWTTERLRHRSAKRLEVQTM